jgi:ABC-type nitrate/sulfonate/bicarbonate transport system ATPase subunit
LTALGQAEPAGAGSGSRPKLAVRGVSKRFGEGSDAVSALEPITLAIAENDFVCLVGPSGCGKSTLLNIIAGFETATTGQVLMDGRAIAGPDAARGVVFQQGSLFPWATVRDNVAFGPLCTGKGRRQAHAIADEHLAMVGLSDFASRYPYELSGGMQQRVGIARALANDPDILLMDEPFAALDAQTRELLMVEIKRIWKQTRKTVFWITHSIEEALFLATDVLVMTARPGRIKDAFRSGFAHDEDLLVTTAPAFMEAKRHVLAQIRQESIKAQAQTDRAHEHGH